MQKDKIKCVVWDLDNTLWKGVLLENDHLQMQPGIREIIRELDQRGILQSIASRNNHDTAMARLEQFGISAYFLYPQIGWQPKSASIATIRDKLNIDIGTFAFIDDDPVERAEVASIFPGVRCVDAAEYNTILPAPAFQPDFVTQDSRRRRIMYLQDQDRKQVEEQFQGMPEDFLASLCMKLNIALATEEDLLRAAELTIRTNQLNTTGITYDYHDLDRFRQSDRHRLYVCELTDRFGSYGKIGLVLLEESEGSICIKLFLLSCRVMNRGIGDVMMSFIMKLAKAAGKELFAEFIHTGKNRQMYITYKFTGFEECVSGDPEILLKHRLDKIRDYPGFIEVTPPPVSIQSSNKLSLT